MNNIDKQEVQAVEAGVKDQDDSTTPPEDDVWEIIKTFLAICWVLYFIIKTFVL